MTADLASAQHFVYGEKLIADIDDVDHSPCTGLEDGTVSCGNGHNNSSTRRFRSRS